MGEVLFEITIIAIRVTVIVIGDILAWLLIYLILPIIGVILEIIMYALGNAVGIARLYALAVIDLVALGLYWIPIAIVFVPPVTVMFLAGGLWWLVRKLFS